MDVRDEVAGLCNGWRVVGDIMLAAMADDVVLVEERGRM